MKMQRHQGEEDIIQLNERRDQLITKNMTLTQKLVAKILITASSIPQSHTVPTRPRHSTSMMINMMTIAMTVSYPIQMSRTAVDLTCVIPLEEGTVRTNRHIFLTQNVSKIFSSDTLIVRSHTHLMIGMLNLTSMRCSLTISRIHMMPHQSPMPPQSITQFTMDLFISHAALDMEEREQQDTELLDMFAHTVTSHLIDVPVADTPGTQKIAASQVNHQKMRSTMPTNALSSSKRHMQDVRSHSHCGEAMDRRRDAVTVNSAKNRGIHNALPASLSLTATFAHLFAQMEWSITKASA